ncbi:carboxymuconolactone decarboxylase family protein [Streptomyces purpureus]|uniref:carboxymuconolactone decarboxylase family protein n=1 Tax=Streptomyces purpureus TaxID=1951 RepID=UPI0003765ABA|nr:carboxymuconolactone decarboxylase family protein [Streptomyces purpureus]
MFTDHTVETAPPAARRAMEAVTTNFGHLPQAVARMAESPHTLDGFLKLSALFEQTTLDPHARETVILTVATRNQCHICIRLHEAKLAKLGPAADDDRLAAVARFTHQVLASAGAVSDEELTAFLSAGYTRQQALEVVLGIGAYTLSTLANRLTRSA